MSEMVVIKIDARLGVIFGWAIVSKINGEDYFDLHGDNVPEQTMLDSAADFMNGAREMRVMHKGQSQGKVLFGLPLTTDLKAALGIQCDKSGLLIGVKPDNPEVLSKYISGEYRAFSVGGYRLEDEIVED